MPPSYPAASVFPAPARGGLTDLGPIGQMRLLNLAVEEAIAREDFDEICGLLARRDEVLAALEARGEPITSEQFRELVDTNDHLARRLRAAQSRLAEAARTQAQVAKVAKAYA